MDRSFSTGLKQLDEVDWNAVEACDWKNRKDGKQAEFLLEQSLPVSLIERIGVTDGRVCFDPYALAADTTRMTDSTVWADTVLNDVLGESLAALDSTREISRHIRGRPESNALGLLFGRRCAPDPTHPRISAGLPVKRGDSVEMQLAGRIPKTGAEPARVCRSTMLLARLDSQWRMVGVVSGDLQVLPRAQ